MGTTLQFIFILFLASWVSGESQMGEQAKCQPVSSPFCNIAKYETMQPFRNTFGHNNIAQAVAEMHKFAFLTKQAHCMSKIQLFFCSLYVPVCVQPFYELLLPCRDVCEQARLACSPEFKKINSNWPEAWDCEKFSYYAINKLCVIDNTNENQSQPRSKNYSQTTPDPEVLERDSGPQSPSTPSTGGVHDKNNSVCGSLFDCRLWAPPRKAICIDTSLVCDGKIDCVDGEINATDGKNAYDGGLDEVNCTTNRCPVDEFYCDEKCIRMALVCNGIVDCSSGSDEQDCYDNSTSIFQSIMLIFSIFSVILVVVKCVKSKEVPEDQVSSKSQVEENPYLPDETIIRNIMNSDQYKPVYEEPYNIIPDCAYERVNKSGSNYTPPSEFYTDLPISRPPRAPVSPAWHPSTSAWSHVPTAPAPTPAPPPPTPAPSGSLYD